MKVSRGLLAGVMLTLAVPVAAQSLGELAKREAERRKNSPPATKTYTNEDLKKIYVPGAVTAEPGSLPAGETQKAEGTADPAKGGDAAKAAEPAAPGESQWRARMTAAREEVRRNEMFRDALQSRINGLTADFTARDDPYQRAQIADDRQKAMAELAQVTKDIETSKKAVTDIEEEARKANVPPGWIR